MEPQVYFTAVGKGTGERRDPVITIQMMSFKLPLPGLRPTHRSVDGTSHQILETRPQKSRGLFMDAEIWFGQFGGKRRADRVRAANREKETVSHAVSIISVDSGRPLVEPITPSRR